MTRATSLADFDINGFHVIASGKTKVLAGWSEPRKNTTHVDPYLGQAVSIYGDLKKKKHEVIAEEVVFHAVDKTPLSGFAIVDRVLSPATPGSGPDTTARACRRLRHSDQLRNQNQLPVTSRLRR